MSRYYAIDKETGHKQYVPNSVVKSIKNDQSQVYGFNAFLRLIKHPMVNWADYSNDKFNKHFAKGIRIAQNAAIKAVLNKAKQLNRH